MPIQVTCPTCSAEAQVPDQYAGKLVACRGCKERLRIPSIVLLEASDEPDPEASKRVEEAKAAQELDALLFAPSNALRRCTCPHCWAEFGPEDILAISRHHELLGDPILGPEAQQRFLPVRFTPEGHALDAKGFPCPDMACPNCHLYVSQALTEVPPIFLSVVGVPASGKSYFLTSMTWAMRTLLPSVFALSFNDADTLSNRALNENEETLFLNPDGDAQVALQKTELQGELYDDITLNGQVVSLPRPFVFSLRPLPQNPRGAENYAAMCRTLVMYDNAGEHFEPGTDSVSNPVTQHLIRSRALLFLFDPTKDPRFRSLCHSDDPQLTRGSRVQRQETLLAETTQRIRRYKGLKQDAMYDRPLIIVVAKCDVWQDLLDPPLAENPWTTSAQDSLGALDVDMIDDVSRQLRDLLYKSCPEFVATAESFSRHVRYIPTSALGQSPTIHPETGMLRVCPKDIHPIWVCVPMLYLLARWGFIPKK